MSSRGSIIEQFMSLCEQVSTVTNMFWETFLGGGTSNGKSPVTPGAVLG